MDFISPSTAIQTARLLSSSTAFLVAGYTLSFSHTTYPALYEHRPQFSAVAFRQIFTQAGKIVPALELISTSSFAYLAYAIPEERTEYTKAAVLMVATFPWTFVVMRKGIERLRRIAGDRAVMEKAEQNLEYRQLLIRLVKQNYVAVGLRFASAYVGLRTLLRS